MEKRLYRSKSDSMVAGVAGGLAEYFSIDPVLVRLIFVIAVLIHGTGALAYIILWIVVPQKKSVYAPSSGVPDDNPDTDPQAEPSHLDVAVQKKRSSLGAYVLIGLGLFFLADNLLPWFDFGNYWPVILIAIGAGLLYKTTKKNESPGGAL